MANIAYLRAAFAVLSLLAQTRVTASQMLSFEGKAAVQCYTGGDFVAAVADPAVQVALISQDVQLQETDWAPFNTPLYLDRNITVIGAFDNELMWPTLDFNYASNKILLAPGVVFNITRLVINNTRYAPHFQAFGWDVFVANNSAAYTHAPAMLLGMDDGVVQRACLPMSLSKTSQSTAGRPPEVPGLQIAYRIPNIPDCVNRSDVPGMQHCWLALGMYEDVAVYAQGIEPASGNLFFAGYMTHCVNITYLCDVVMSDECIAQLGLFGCWYSLFPRTSGSPPSPLPPPRPPQPPPPLPPSPLEAVAAAPPNTSHRNLLAPLLAGILGGLALLAVIAAIFAVVVWRQCKSSASSTEAISTKASGDKQSATSTQKGTETTCGSDGNSGEGSDVNHVEVSLDTAPETAGKHTAAKPSAVTDRQQQKPRRGEPDLVVVTSLTPVLPGINLKLADGEVQLTSRTLGKGAYGRVVVGNYGGKDVAVKLINRGLLPPISSEEAAAVWPSIALAGVKEAASSTAGFQSAAPILPVGASSAGRTFDYEVAVLARCQHPHIVRLLAASLDPSKLCLVMELMDTSLERMLRGSGGTAAPGEAQVPPALLPLPKVLHIAMQIVKALSYLHPTCVHRDLKPANVLISNPDSEQPLAKLADFGLSRLANTVLVTENPEVGTAPYMAPEVFDPSNYVVTDRTDIYAFGVILWQMLSGKAPWEGIHLVQIAFAVTARCERLPLSAIEPARLPPKLAALITACWDPDPARRPAAAEVVKTLALVQQLGADATGPSSSPF